MKVICVVLPILALVNAEGQYSNSASSNSPALNGQTQTVYPSQSSSDTTSSQQQNAQQYYSPQASSYASQSVPYPPSAQSAVYASPVLGTPYTSGQTGIYAPATDDIYPPAVEETEVQPYANSQVNSERN